jgi:hypothetical protein
VLTRSGSLNSSADQALSGLHHSDKLCGELPVDPDSNAAHFLSGFVKAASPGADVTVDL